MIEPSPFRRKYESIIFTSGIAWFIACFLLMRRFEIVNSHRVQAFALIFGLVLLPKPCFI